MFTLGLGPKDWHERPQGLEAELEAVIRKSWIKQLRRKSSWRCGERLRVGSDIIAGGHGQK